MHPTLACLALIAVISVSAGAWAADDDAPIGCKPFDRVKEVGIQHGVNFVPLSNDQWEFLRGISAMSPTTPTGLPPGDRAVLGTADDKDGGIILFIDGKNACSPFPVPKELLDLIMDVGKGIIHHEGDPS